MDTDLDDELKADFEEQVKLFLNQGFSAEEARRQASLIFGGLDQIKESCREARGIHLLDTVFQDFVYAARALRRNPAFSLVAILTLAIGIGINATTLSLLYTMFFRVLPVADSA